MADLSRLPETASLETLEQVVDHFLVHRNDLPQMDYEWLDYVNDARSLKEAIHRACMSRNAKGKKYHHQGRVWDVNLTAFADALTSRSGWLRRSQDFLTLYERVDSLAPKGIGPVTKYDVSYRIGLFLGLRPEHVFVQAGVIEGAKALGLDVRGKRYLRQDEIPRALWRIPAWDVEDFLCGYRTVLKRIGHEVR